MSKYTTSKLFLTEADHHHPMPFRPRRLRSYIMSHSLFFDRLVVGDSQLNNNLNLRYLISDAEHNSDMAQGTPQDLSILLREGYLVPAMRKDYESLEQLRLEHLKHEVNDLPLREYVAFVDQQLAGKRELYDSDKVGKLFKRRVLDTLSSDSICEPGLLSKSIAAAACEFVENQEVLLYKSLKNWAQGEVSKEKMTTRQYQILDEAVAGSYRHNVPLSMGSNIDAPISSRREIYPFDGVLGSKQTFSMLRGDAQLMREYELRPAVFLSEQFLSKLPANALPIIKGSNDKKLKPLAHYRNVARLIETFRSGKPIDIDILSIALEQYLNEVELVVRDNLFGSTKADYLSMKNKARKGARLRLSVDSAVSVIGLLPVVGNAIAIVYAGYGGVENLRKAALQEDYLSGYMAGKAASEDPLLIEVTRPRHKLRDT